MDISSIRYANLQLLVNQRGGLQKGGLAALARDLGKGQAQLSQIGGASPIKNIGTRLAREIEQTLGFPAGWMDTPQKAAPSGVRDSATVAYLPSQPAGRQDLTIRFARAAADKVASRMGIERSSDDYLVVFDEIHRSIKEALESEVPDNRVDLVGKLSPNNRGDEDNADRREDERHGEHAGGANRSAARKPAAKPGKRR